MKNNKDQIAVPRIKVSKTDREMFPVSNIEVGQFWKSLYENEKN